MGRTGRWLLVLLIALAAGIAAFFGSRALLVHEEPPAPPAIHPAVVPERRPDIQLADRDGRLRALSEWSGKPAVINFWATWCAPCRREIPMLNALTRDPSFSGFAMIGVAIDFREDVLRFLSETPVNYTVLIGEQDGLDAARAFGMESIGLPFTVFTDRRDRIVTIHVGELHRPEADLILSVVRAIDTGRIDLKAAQAQIRVQLPNIG